MRQNGFSGECELFRVDGSLIAFISAVGGSLGGAALGLFVDEIVVTDEGWWWVEPNGRRFRDVSGVVTDTHAAATDSPASHDSHDLDIKVQVGQQVDLLSDVGTDSNGDGEPDTLGLEWEIGTFPGERAPRAPERYFPKWAWPSVGDRIWANGAWTYDCGHPDTHFARPRFKTELHPLRALAVMRDQFQTLPGTGATPVRVTATDVYIHGQSGYVADILNCGTDILLSRGRCGNGSTLPIAENYAFDIPLPPRPFGAVLATNINAYPEDTVPEPTFAPTLEPRPPENPTSIRVTIPLGGSGKPDTAVYARRILAGWIARPSSLGRLSLSMDKMDLHDDKDVDPGDCECTFFWLNVDRAPRREYPDGSLRGAWIRLVDFAEGNMNSYDADECTVRDPTGGCLVRVGSGEMDFQGATFDFYVGGGQPFHIRASGYDQDCFDDHFGDHGYSVATYATCYLDALAHGELSPHADQFGELEIMGFRDASGVGPYRLSGVGGSCFSASTSPNRFRCAESGSDGQYEMEFTVNELPLSDEIRADLRLSKACDDRALEGEAFTCQITVENLGPGLPAGFRVEETLSTGLAPGRWTLNSANTIVEHAGVRADATACRPFFDLDQLVCSLASVPVGGRAVITISLTVPEPARLTDSVTIVDAGEDPDPSNNEAQDTVNVVQVVGLDVRPGSATNPVKVGPSGGSGRIPVAILSDPDFDASVQVDRSSLTFGRTGDEQSLSSCPDAQDVNADGMMDLLCLFNNDPRLFQVGDAQGILRGRRLDGILIEGRDAVVPVP